MSSWTTACRARCCDTWPCPEQPDYEVGNQSLKTGPAWIRGRLCFFALRGNEYALLIREAIQTLAADRKWVGGTLGIIAVLHTSSRTMKYHPHAHLLVTALGLHPDPVAVRLTASMLEVLRGQRPSCRVSTALEYHMMYQALRTPQEWPRPQNRTQVP